MNALEVVDVRLGYAERAVVAGLSFSLAPGEIGCLLGASGGGKTTVLRAIGGFESLQQGSIRLAGQLVSAPGLTLPPAQRQFGMVFQDYALFPHLRVVDNIGFGLRRQSAAERRQRVEALLELVGLRELAQRYPHQLSGGQQQRVALARALAPQPRLLLLDEPFSSLDSELRASMAAEVRELLKRLGTSALLVTHDQHEAFAMADRIGILHQGRLAQWGTPYEVYHHPADRFVADFVGEGVWLDGTLDASGRVWTELGEMRGVRCADAGVETQFDVLLRPDDVVYAPDAPQQARLLHKAFRGADSLYTLGLPSGQRLLALVPSHLQHQPGEPIGFALRGDHLVAFPRAATGAGQNSW